MAKLAIDYKPEYKDQICFHSQQAAEKYLKAYLVLRDITFKKTHSLVYLLDLLGEFETIPDTIYRAAEILEDYGVEVWEKRFKEFQAGGKTQAWCKENNINPRAFNFWYLKLQREQTQPQKQIREPVKWLAIDTKEIEINPEANLGATSHQAIDIKIAKMTIEISFPIFYIL
jgi:hypothetical protein